MFQSLIILEDMDKKEGIMESKPNEKGAKRVSTHEASSSKKKIKKEQELKTAFNYHFKSCIDEEELVKLANLYFLYNVLIPRQNHNMLDDKEKFRNYPWGRLCFSLTKQFIQNAVKSKRKSKNSETESKAYAFLQGFPMVLAYWAYEIPPQLASSYLWSPLLHQKKKWNLNIKDLKKQHKEDLDCLKKGQEEIVRLLLSLTEVVNQRLSYKCESEKKSQEPLEKNPPPSISLEMIDVDVDKEKEIEDNEETEEDDNHRENKSKMVHDTSNKVKINSNSILYFQVVQEKTKVKIMEIATNIEKTRLKRQPKPSKKVLENVKEQKNARGKKNDSPKPT
uniref:DUF1985 domain-containing protein n=1 Tax=Cucumis melo TaxID=3656 RepID=A0A9I9E9Y5_CUCME